MKITKPTRTMAIVGANYAFLFLANFVAFKSVAFFFAAGAALFLVTSLETYRLFRQASGRFEVRLLPSLAVWLIFAGSVGLGAATQLTREKLALAASPDHVTACSLSPVVACSPVIKSPEASAFAGLPNPVLGIFGFACLLAAGMTLLAGAKPARWWWQLLWLGSLAGFGFVGWLIYQTLYDIGALCLYCMAAWFVTIPTFYYLTTYTLAARHLPGPTPLVNFWRQNHLVMPVATFLFILILIYLRFDEYWQSLI